MQIIMGLAAWFKAAPWKRKQPSTVERAFAGAE
jgi:hypothetical protein